MTEKNISTKIQVLTYNELTSEDKKVVDLAKEATKSSYTPYSHFNVGAALLLDNGVNTVIGREYVKIAIMMLMRAGIEIIAGAEGDADKAIEEYLAETLITEEKTSCGHSCADCDRGCSK